MIKPCKSLHKRLFFGVLDLGLAQVGTDRETVFDAAKQIQLVVLASFAEYILRLVAKLTGKDAVGLYRTVW